MVSTINATTSSGVITTADNSGALTFQTGGTSALTLSATQQVTIPSGSILNASGRPMVAQTGGILQVVSSTYSTATTTNSTSFVTTGISASITPSTTSSKILIIITPVIGVNGATGGSVKLAIYRNGSSLIADASDGTYGTVAGTTNYYKVESKSSFTYLDSPATTSSTTYALYFALVTGSNAESCLNNSPAQITLMEIAQ
jgi:hypothetical protein